MNSIFGPYLLGRAQPYLTQLERLQPRVALFFQPDLSDVRAFRNVCPDTIVVGRVYRPDSEVSDRIKFNPEDAALWAHNLILAEPTLHYVDYWTIENEVMQYWNELPSLNLFMLERMRLAGPYGYGCGLAGFSVGQPDLPVNNRMAFWQLVYPAMLEAKQMGHAFLVHAYGWRDLWGPAEKGGADYLIHRLEHQVLPRLPFTPPKFIVSEYGLDGLLVGPQAKGYVDGIGAEAYLQSLLDVGPYLEQWSDVILGYCIFCLGNNGDAQWNSYSIAGRVLGGLADAQVAPYTPGETNVDEVKVYDIDGTEKDVAWLASNWEGCKVLRAKVPTGEEVFRIVAVYITTGTATMIAEVRDVDGKPKAGQPVAMTYPSLENPDPQLPDLTASQAKNLWSKRGAYQTINAEGHTGFGLGGNYGPLYNVWVISPGAYADCLTMTGMKGGTNHHGPLHVVFQLVTEASELTFEQTLEAEAEKHDVLPIYEDSAFVKVAAPMGLWPTGDEFRFDYDGVRYAARRFRDPKSAEIVALWAIDGDWGNVVPHVYYNKAKAATRSMSSEAATDAPEVDGGVQDKPASKIY